MRGFYVGHMLASQDCHALDATGLPCGQPTILQSPIPICRAHAIELDAHLRVAIVSAPFTPAERARKVNAP